MCVCVAVGCDWEIFIFFSCDLTRTIKIDLLTHIRGNPEVSCHLFKSFISFPCIIVWLYVCVALVVSCKAKSIHCMKDLAQSQYSANTVHISMFLSVTHHPLWMWEGYSQYLDGAFSKRCCFFTVSTAFYFNIWSRTGSSWRRRGLHQGIHLTHSTGESNCVPLTWKKWPFWRQAGLVSHQLRSLRLKEDVYRGSWKLIVKVFRWTQQNIQVFKQYVVEGNMLPWQPQHFCFRLSTIFWSCWLQFLMSYH